MLRQLIAVALSTTMAVPGLAKAPTKKRTVASSPSAPYGDPNRPPQFVLLAFDGSKENAFWDESVAVAEKIKTDGGKRSIKYTYFINPTYYLAQENRKQYLTPGVNRAGVSCIGYSNALEDIAPRIARTNKAFKAGHEIGSHANSHCDQRGKEKEDPMETHPWTFKDWDSEFTQFNRLLFDSLKINKIKASAPSDYPNGYSFTVDDIKGFRAPKLAYTTGMWAALQKHGFTYDTSMEAPPDMWPQKSGPLTGPYADSAGSFKGWRFPLGRIKIAGTSRTTLSMDFNWYFFHSGATKKKNMTDADFKFMHKQMLDSYKYYFKVNYLGNRAPVNIGHHFSRWNNGVYWKVMQDFAKDVCNMPEVKCVTYAEYAKYLDGLSSDRLQEYRAGKGFTRLKMDTKIKDIDTPVLANIRLDIGANRFEAVVADPDKVRVNTLGWKPELQLNTENQNTTVLSRGEIAQKVTPGETVLVRATLLNKSGVEMNWQTYKIHNFGTDKESIYGPLEDYLLEGESAEAHADHD